MRAVFNQLDRHKIGQVLAMKIEPHKHASRREPYPQPGPPQPPRQSKWPTPAYRAKRDAVAKRRKEAA
jgi:hypothetical protein